MTEPGNVGGNIVETIGGGRHAAREMAVRREPVGK